jgi:hypothetical protein
MPRLPPTEKTIKQLFALSGNVCAFPKCTQRIIDESYIVVGAVCHIEAANLGGPRYNSLQSDEERRSLHNLILLCANHHRITDNEQVYTVAKLKEMKDVHEKKHLSQPYEIPSHALKRVMNEVLRRLEELYNLEPVSLIFFGQLLNRQSKVVK